MVIIISSWHRLVAKVSEHKIRTEIATKRNKLCLSSERMSITSLLDLFLTKKHHRRAYSFRVSGAFFMRCAHPQAGNKAQILPYNQVGFTYYYELVVNNHK